MDESLINVGKLHEELKAAGIPVESVHSDSKIEYSRHLSAAEKILVEQLLKDHDPAPVPFLTTDQMIRALWKKVMLADPKDADELLKILE